jgi:hypothetical protein
VKRQPRYPVSINGQMLRAIFTKPQKPCDTRPFLVRLASSLKFIVRGDFKKGIRFVGVTGGADF